MTIADLVFFDEHQAEFEESVTAAEKCVRGRSLQRSWHHFTSGDGKFLAGLREAEPGCWAVSYTENEFCQILVGLSVLRDAGDERVLRVLVQGTAQVLVVLQVDGVVAAARESR